MSALVRSMRPPQWTKNLLVFAGYLFTIEQAHPPRTFLVVVAAFAVFCAVSSAGYLINDVADAESDRKHPQKRMRPIASGELRPSVALGSAAVLLTAALAVGFALDTGFGLMAAGYLVLTMVYSVGLKHVVILDLLAIAMGFVMRAAAGAVVIHVRISPWLLACATLLALFLGLAKRRSELVALEMNAQDHRRTLVQYTIPMLDQMLSIAASAALMAYFLYTFAPGSETAQRHPYMMITVPFVIYGLFRYLYLIHTVNAGGSPERVLLEDRPTLVNIVLYVIAVVAALKH